MKCQYMYFLKLFASPLLEFIRFIWACYFWSDLAKFVATSKLNLKKWKPIYEQK